MGYTISTRRANAPPLQPTRSSKSPPISTSSAPQRSTITYGTAYHALAHRALMRPGETLAVLGASGGVGLAAVELARIMGARVIACASSDEKLVFARNHGAHEVANYDSEDSARRAQARRRRPWHRCRVRSGGRPLQRAGRFARSPGRGGIVVVGFAAGDIPRPPGSNLVLLKGCAILGVFRGPGSVATRNSQGRHRPARAGAPRASSRATFRRSTARRRRQRRSRPSPTARSWEAAWCGWKPKFRGEPRSSCRVDLDQLASPAPALSFRP